MDAVGLNIVSDEGAAPTLPISPLEGEMSGRTEGGAVPPTPQLLDIANLDGNRSTLPPSALPGISPSRGEIGSVKAARFTILAEQPADIPAREALLDRAMGPGRRRKSSEKLRRGRLPAEGLAFLAKNDAGHVVGTVRLWNVGFAGEGAAVKLPISPTRREIGGCERGALLLGPLAVEPSQKSAGIGSALMRFAIAEAARLGHGAILLVGDAAYYSRFGFSADKTGAMSMPGPYERERFLALELVEGSLAGASGTLRPTGRASRPRAADPAAASLVRKAAAA